MNPTALAETVASVTAVDALFPPTRPTMTASTSSPMTSSMTAAPRMICPSAVCTRFMSLRTRAVMPTLVAHSVAPRKSGT